MCPVKSGITPYAAYLLCIPSICIRIDNGDNFWSNPGSKSFWEYLDKETFLVSEMGEHILDRPCPHEALESERLIRRLLYCIKKKRTLMLEYCKKIAQR